MAIAEPTLNAQEVLSVVRDAMANKATLPLTFIETQTFEKLSFLLGSYINPADITWMLTELKEDFFKGFTSMTSKELHTIIHHCRKCPEVSPPPVLPSWNCVDPDLLIVADNPSAVDPYSNSLVVALKEAGFTSDRCMVTYVTRCAMAKPPKDVVERCLPYLYTEMAIINPKLTITLGLASYRAVTGDGTSKLADVKGSVIQYGLFPLMPEASLGWVNYQQEQTQSAKPLLLESFVKAHKFLYSGG